MADIYVKRRMRGPSGFLFVSFALGVAVGFSICYAWFSVKGQPPAGTEAPIATQPGERAAEGESAEPEPPPESTAVREPPSDVWPARYLFLAVRGQSLDDVTSALLKEIKPGGVVLLEGNMADAGQTRELASQIKTAVAWGPDVHDLPLIAIGHEDENRSILGIDDAPAALELGKRKDKDAARQLGRRIASAALSLGVGVLLEPVLDVYDPEVAEESTESRCFGRDQEVVATIGLALADGIEGGGAIAVGKSFPGTGVTRKVDGQDLTILDKGVPRLAELMYPFSEAASHKIPGILAGHVAVPNLDEDEPERPASVSPVLITRVLREHWHYDGVVLADDVAADTMPRPAEEAVVEALVAGCDAVLFLDPDPERIRAVCAAIDQAVYRGALTLEQLAHRRKRLEVWQDTLKSSETDKRVEPPAEAAPVAAEPPAGQEKPEAKPEDKEPEEEKADLEPEDAKPVEQEPAEEPAEEPAVEPAEEPAEQPAEEAAPEPTEKPEEKPEEKPVEEAELPAEDEAAERVAQEQPEEEEQKTEPAPVETAQPVSEDVQPPNTEKIVHLIERGETLSRLAKQYGVKMSDVVKWNNLKDPKIKYGFTLTIYTPIQRADEDEEAPAETAPTETAPTETAPQADPGEAPSATP